MASPYPINTRYKITEADHGNILKLGNAAEGAVGTWQVQFVPDASFVGSFAVLARSDHKDAHGDAVPYVSVPYRKVFLNDLPADYSLASDIITSGSILQIPSSGLSVALLVECTAGFGYLYSKPLDGPSVV